MSLRFKDLLNDSKRISKDEFASSFGNIADDILDMLTGDKAKSVIREARDIIENADKNEPLPNGSLRFRRVEFGKFSQAPELEEGKVAAVDGTPVLPLQKYSAGQAICVGIGSLSHRRPMQDSLHYWSSKLLLEGSQDNDDFITRVEQGAWGISQTAYLRYFEAKHGLELEEPIIFFDGPIVYEWLVSSKEGIEVYQNLFKTKKCIGIIKSLKATTTFAIFARAIQPGEIFVIETLKNHLLNSNAQNKNEGERQSVRYVKDEEFLTNIASKVLRGVFKTKKKAFGFEVHIDHLEDMLRIMSADCQLNNIGHEIPYLLNRVDEAVKTSFNSRILKDRIDFKMTNQSEDLFFDERSEREFR